MLDVIVHPLMEWYANQKRTLPWRSRPTPYRVWVSEIMLQQTRVEAVKPYFARFMKELPDIKTLASCPEEKLLKLWEGLGYYNRVRNMQKAAQMIMDKYEGELPAQYEELKKLPGIGTYTAGAIASIAFGIPVPAMDGNVLRVLTRILADGRDISKEAVKKSLAEQIQEIIPLRQAGDFNQALIELGAMICVPNGMAKCEECPLECFCRARQENKVMEYPKKTQKKARAIEYKTILLVIDGEKILIRKRPAKGLLAGLYELPNLEGTLDEQEVLAAVRTYGLRPLHIKKLEDSKHIFTHKEWHMTGYAVRVEEMEEKPEGALLVKRKDVEGEYPIPTAFSVYVKYKNILLGQEKYN